MIPTQTINVDVNLSGLDQSASSSVSAITRQNTVGVAVIQGPTGLTGPQGPQGVPGDIEDVYVQLAANPESIIVGAITRDADGAALSAGVIWPDGEAGTYTATTVSTDFPGAVDAYTVTYTGTPSKTYTQSAVTRDSIGAVTFRPQIGVS
jgi:hypothetical protein